MLVRLNGSRDWLPFGFFRTYEIEKKQ